MSERLPKILFVCNADSIHAQSWIQLLKGTSFDVRVFASPFPADVPPAWTFPTYSVVKPTPRPDMPRTYWLLPARGSLMRKVLTRVEREYLHLSEKWLRRVIMAWRPDIVHSLRMSAEGGLALRSLNTIPRSQRPKWIVSAWGVDIRWHLFMPEYREQVLEILRTCDGFISDCQSDLDLALSNGLLPTKVVPGAPFPGTGGLDWGFFAGAHKNFEVSKRRTILIPKAMESFHLKAFTVIESLRMAFEAGMPHETEIWLLQCSPMVREWLNLMPQSLRRICHCCDALPHDQVINLMLQSRVMVAPTLVDGSPNVMWEAMAAGSLPILSPLDSIREVITHGKNGLLASALSCDQIAEAIIRGMTDDELVERAAQQNWRIVQARANREEIRPMILQYYRRLVESRSDTKRSSSP